MSTSDNPNQLSPGSPVGSNASSPPRSPATPEFKPGILTCRYISIVHTVVQFPYVVRQLKRCTCINLVFIFDHDMHIYLFWNSMVMAS